MNGLPLRAADLKAVMDYESRVFTFLGIMAD